MEQETLFVSFSGGRTSAFMSHWLIENMSDKFDLRFVFANTGQEHEKTLEFVDRCDREFGLGLVWLEAAVNENSGVGTTSVFKSYETASRKGEPFEDVIKKYGIPNPDYPHCTRELKLSPIRHYKRTCGFKSNHKTAVGIRVDEIDRMASSARENGIIYPLISMRPTTKQEIRHWWRSMPFDLDLPEHLGNCVTCWKKSDRKLLTIAKNQPSLFNFMIRMEEEHAETGSGNARRSFFRKYRMALDILEESKSPFREFQDHMPEWQLGLFGEMDVEFGCGSGCDIDGALQ